MRDIQDLGTGLVVLDKLDKATFHNRPDFFLKESKDLSKDHANISCSGMEISSQRPEDSSCAFLFSFNCRYSGLHVSEIKGTRKADESRCVFKYRFFSFLESIMWLNT